MIRLWAIYALGRVKYNRTGNITRNPLPTHYRQQIPRYQILYYPSDQELLPTIQQGCQ